MVLNDVTMPVVGTPEKVNDTFVEQITMNAEAAIATAAEMGVIDPARVAIGGHSYGAFMTANLIYEMDNKDKMTKFVEELRTTGIPVLPPDVNESGWEFTVIKSGADAKSSDQTQAKIRFGFGGVKAVGEGAAADRIRRALGRVLESGATLTADLGGSSSTQQFADAVCKML